MAAALLETPKIAFFSTPKAGSTSMKMVLYRLKTGEDWTGDPDRVHPQFPTHPIKPGDFDGLDDYWKFAIIRDPISRYLSSFYNRVHTHRDIARENGKTLKARAKFYLRNPGLRLYPGVENYFRNITRYQKVCYSVWHHTTSVKNFVGDDLNRLDAVFRVEDIPALEAELTQRTGTPISLPREQTSDVKLRLTDLSPAAQAIVREETDADYDFLSDYYARPA